MAVRSIYKYPDSMLKRVSADVRQISGRTAGLLNDMVETMYAAAGIGLAAPQLGVLERAIVVDTDTEDRGKKLIKLINPSVVESSGSITWDEGCLSVVNYTAEITRPSNVLVHGWSIDQKEIELEFEGLDAVCIQHEIDHLEGILFIDHISKLKRQLYRNRMAKLAKQEGERDGDSRGSRHRL